MRRLFTLLLVAFFLLVSIATVQWFGDREPDVPAAAHSSEQKVSDSHERMVRALEDVRKNSLVDNPYFETERVKTEGLKLETMPLSGNERQHVILHLYQMEDYRRLGDNEKATEHLRQAERIRSEANLTFSPEETERILFECGLTYLRQGEAENCVHCRNGESCILPIRGSGIHEQRSGSSKAMEYFQRILQTNPDHLKAKWLLNLAAMTLGEYPSGVPEAMRIPPDRFESGVAFPRFREIGASLQLHHVDCGGAGIVDDFDNDGWLDIFAATWDPAGQVHLFRNTGRGEFEKEVHEAGLTGLLGGINGAQADFDNDGDVDIFLVRGAWLGKAGRYPNSLLWNSGGGAFRDVTFQLGLGDVHYPSSTAAWADFDLDGDLDLFVGNEYAPCQLFRNDLADGFTDIAPTAGVTNGECTKGSSWGDYNGDRRPDLYVSNLEGPNRLYHNNGDGTFTDVAAQLGVDEPFHSFPAWFWDVNNDGHLDLYVASYDVGVEHVAADSLGLPASTEPDRLYLNDRKGGFEEVSRQYGLTRTTQPMGCNFGDLDNDGFPDFYLGTGYPGFEALMPNLMFHNLGGEKFEDVSLPGGFAHLQKGHGTAFADLDNDGDQDVFMQMGGADPGDAFGNVLYENPGFGNHWIRLKLVGETSNRSGIGTRIKVVIVEDGRRRTIYKWVNSGGSFGGNPLQPQIGLGDAERIELLEVYWPASDRTQEFHDLPADRMIVIHEDRYEPEISKLLPVEFKTDRQAESATKAHGDRNE